MKKDFLKGSLDINKNCHFQEIDDSLYILNVETGRYHEINSIGSEIFNFISNNKPTYNELLEYFESEYPNNNIREDIQIFVNELVTKKILII